MEVLQASVQEAFSAPSLRDVCDLTQSSSASLGMVFAQAEFVPEEGWSSSWMLQESSFPAEEFAPEAEEPA